MQTVTYVALDIETVGAPRATEWWLRENVKAPSNYKDEEKIEAYKKNAREKLMSKSALTWHTGVVFSYAMVDKNGNKTFDYDLDEKLLLERLASKMTGLTAWTKSGKDFDFPFLTGRYLANNIPLPNFLVKRDLQKDVDEIFSFSKACNQRMSLDAYAFGLGIDPKTTSYKIVEEAYTDLMLGDNTKLKELEEYNLRDAEIVMEIVKRYKQ